MQTEHLSHYIDGVGLLSSRRGRQRIPPWRWLEIADNRHSAHLPKISPIPHYQGKIAVNQWFGDTEDMDEARARLIEAAKAACGAFRLRENFSVGSVGAAILTAQGNIHTGICVDLACGLGCCAEAAAVAAMLKARETHVLAVVAVSDAGVLSAPCGRCRETIAQVDMQNLDCAVILGDGREVPLRALLPEHWLIEQEDTEQARAPGALPRADDA